MSDDDDIGVNRSRMARERAGLSLSQAAKLLGWTETELAHNEREHPESVRHHDRLADIYGVSVEWLLGEVPLRDYAAVRTLHGHERLCFSDRDELATFMASLPTRSKP